MGLNSDTKALTFREAYADETARAASLCTPGPVKPGEGPTRCFVAVKDYPVERLVGAAFYREIPNSLTNTSVAECEWAMIAGLAGSDHELAFLAALLERVRETLPEATALQTSAWWPERGAAFLTKAGWQMGEGRVPYAGQAAAWVAMLAEGEASTGEGPERIRPLEVEDFKGLKTLLCGGDRPQMRPSDLAHGFQTAWGQSPALFDPRCSAVCLCGDQPIAVCLANVHQTHLSIQCLAAENDSQVDRLLKTALEGAATLGAEEDVSFHLTEGLDHVPYDVQARMIERFPVERGMETRRYRITLCDTIPVS